MRKSNRLPAAASVAILALSLIISSCTSGNSAGEPDVGPTRDDVVAEITDDVIGPGLAKSASSIDALDKSMTELCAAPSDKLLDTARESWRQARLDWMATSAYRVGPIGELHTKAKIAYPINPDKLESLLNSGEIDLNQIDQLGAHLRGLGGVEYVLFSTAGFSDLEPARCAYALAATTSALRGATELSEAWTGGYAKEFKASHQQAIDDLINASLASLAAVGDMTLGPASGKTTGTVDVATADPGRAQSALADASAELRSVRAVYSTGLADLVEAKSASAAKSFDGSLTSAIKSIDSMTTLDDPTAASSAFRHVSEARVSLRTEVASQLGVTVTFTDSDGDG
ncbi:MAG: imelysin family protein [Microthrixaceae bacterium]